MYVEMVCNCECSLTVEPDGNYESAWALTWRFANAHVGCGFVTPNISPEEETMDLLELPEEEDE
jgi:hypothetical protein